MGDDSISRPLDFRCHDTRNPDADRERDARVPEDLRAIHFTLPTG
jgi:hypothetical protein